jgi:DNA-binding transcriptional LysR family regulator
MALRCFREAARRKSIRKAAEGLGLSPSSVHRQVIKLEEQVGSPLFERSSDGVRLTAAGEVFYRYVQRAHHDLDQVMSEIDDLRGVRRGHVRVACEEGLGKDFLPHVLTPFRKKYTGVGFTVRIMDMPGIVAGVAEGEFEVGVAFNPQTHAGIKRHGQMPVAVGAVVLPGHPLAKRKQLRLADLVGEPLIVADSGFTIRRMLDVQAGSSREHLNIVAETNSFEAITALVKSGAGVAIRTRTGIAEEIARGEVVFVPISERGFHMETIAVITRAKWPLPVAAAIFVEQLVAGLPMLGDAAFAPRAAKRA